MQNAKTSYWDKHRTEIKVKPLLETIFIKQPHILEIVPQYSQMF